MHNRAEEASPPGLGNVTSDVSFRSATQAAQPRRAGGTGRRSRAWALLQFAYFRPGRLVSGRPGLLTALVGGLSESRWRGLDGQGDLDGISLRGGEEGLLNGTCDVQWHESPSGLVCSAHMRAATPCHPCIPSTHPPLRFCCMSRAQIGNMLSVNSDCRIAHEMGPEGYDYEPRRSAPPIDLKPVSTISAVGTATAPGANPRPSAPATPHPGPWQRAIPAASAARSGLAPAHFVPRGYLRLRVGIKGSKNLQEGSDRRIGEHPRRITPRVILRNANVVS